MKVLLQRVSRAEVRVDGDRVARIGAGLLVLFGVEHGDDETLADMMADKTVDLRIFRDNEGKMNHSVEQERGSVLVVSQFTLAATTAKGRRPSYAGAAEPRVAEAIYEHYIHRIRARGVPVEHGAFGAMMQVELINDGPVTILLDPPTARGAS